MQYASPWLSELSSRERQQRPEDTYGRFLCWYSNTDNIVFPLPPPCCRVLTTVWSAASATWRWLMMRRWWAVAGLSDRS